MGSIDRVTLRWPGVAIDPASPSPTIACGVPGPAGNGGFRASSLSENYVAARRNTAEQSYQKLVIPNSSARGPVRAISIAPDSAIACCDLALGGRDGETYRHRISPGNPFVGTITEDDFASISIPESMPYVGVNEHSVMIDAEPVFALDDGMTLYGWPLRLELHRGNDAMLVRSFRRAPLVAEILAAGASNNDGDLSEVYMICVDGRRRMRLSAHSIVGASTYTLSVSAGLPHKISGDALRDEIDEVLLPLNNAGDTSVTLADDESQLFTFDDLSAPILVIRLTSSDAAADQYVDIKLRAED